MRCAALLVTVSLLAPGAQAADDRPQVLILDLQQGTEAPANTARTLTDLLTIEASNHPGLRVLSGADLRSLAELESERAVLGCEDSSCLAELAGAIGARFVISGRVSKLGGLWLLQLSLFDAIAAEAISRVALKSSALEGFVEEIPTGVKKLLAGVAPLLEREAASGGDATTTTGTGASRSPDLGTAVELTPPTDTTATDVNAATNKQPVPSPPGERQPPNTSTTPDRPNNDTATSTADAAPAGDDALGLGVGAYVGMGLVGAAALGLVVAVAAMAIGGTVFMTKMPNEPITVRYIGGATAAGGAVLGLGAMVAVIGGSGLIIGGFIE